MTFKKDVLEFLDKEIVKRKLEKADLRVKQDKISFMDHYYNDKIERLQVKIDNLSHEIIMLMGLKLKVKS